jgi:hypothetical protein
MKFTNENRNRKYGKRVGDIVYRYNDNDRLFEVISIDFLDNNRFRLKSISNGYEFDDTPEHYDIKTKIEDI